MILSDLRTYLAARKQVTIVDLANRFAAEPDALRGMLDHFAALLAQVVANPGVRVRDLEIISPEEHRALLQQEGGRYR